MNGRLGGTSVAPGADHGQCLVRSVQGRGRRGALGCNSWLSQCAAARAGRGLAALRCFLGDWAAALVRVLRPEPSLAGELWLVTHPGLRRTARVRAFMKTLGRGLQRERARLEGAAA